MSRTPRQTETRTLARRVRKIVPFVAAGFCLLVGLVLLGQGLWIPIKAELAQILLNRAWAKTLDGDAVPPWPWADATPVAELTIAGERFVVLSRDSGEALAFAPGHVPGSVLPGEPGLSVIAAHRDTHFKALGRLAPGDVVMVRGADGNAEEFHVEYGQIVDARQDTLFTGGDAPRLALVTCWPLDSPVPGGPLRLVLYAALRTSLPVR